MANLHKLYGQYCEKITLSTSKIDSLKTSRDALRTDVKKWFSKKGKSQPKFCWQGSFAMKTLVNPLGDGDYDLDDGVYLQGYENKSMDEWETASTVHQWVKDAVKDRTSKDVIDKNTCVRVPYAAGYHIDLPIYILKDDVIYLAHKSSGWTESDPKAFRDWFVDKVKSDDYGEQLRRVVKYLKGWRDYKGIPIKGIELTILAVNAFNKYDNRDDKALKNIVKKIVEDLDYNFTCSKPVVPYEDLFESKSSHEEETIKKALKELKESLEKAVALTDEKEASEEMRKVFGSRFPLGQGTSDNNFTASKKPGVLKNDGRSA